jgi:hypothetical protein
MQSLDLAEPVDYVDPAGGGDYFAAGTKLSARGRRQWQGTTRKGTRAIRAPIPYFEMSFPSWPTSIIGRKCDAGHLHQRVGSLPRQYGATSALADLDFYASALRFLSVPSNWQPLLAEPVLVALSLATIGMSYYNAGQVTLRHPMSHGLQMDVSYTYSRSIDMGSDAERGRRLGSGSFSDILNTWKPYLNRGVSDFDTAHLVTVDWVYQLPFGRGKACLANSNQGARCIIGGWQWSGINRNVQRACLSRSYEPGWTTNWQIESYGVVTGRQDAAPLRCQNGNPQFFDNPTAINNGISLRHCPAETSPALSGRSRRAQQPSVATATSTSTRA